MKKFAILIILIKSIALLLLIALSLYINYFGNNKLLTISIIAVVVILLSVETFVNKRLCRIKQSQSEKNLGLLKLKSEELAALNSLSAIITSSYDIDEVMKYLYQIFNNFTGCDRLFISFLDQDTNLLHCRYEVGDVVHGEVGRFFNEDSTVTQSFKNNKTIIRSDTYLRKRGTNGDKVAIPLRVSENLVGALFLESGVPQTLKDVNVSFVENLANYAAIAIKNAELFSNIYAQKQEIQALYEQAAAVNGTLNSYVKELDNTKIELVEKNKELTEFYEKIQSSYFNTVMALANSIEAKDAYTRGHCQRVMEISCEIAKRMGYCEDQIQDLRYASVLHDIGKIGIPAYILRKQSKLTEEEYEEIRKHPLISFSILKDVNFLENASKAILQHHERYDGRGYPNGLRGGEICEYARIMNIADAFDAMTSDRPYRKAMTMEIALAEIKTGKGSQFDPEVADIFIEMGNELIADFPY